MRLQPASRRPLEPPLTPQRLLPAPPAQRASPIASSTGTRNVTTIHPACPAVFTKRE